MLLKNFYNLIHLGGLSSFASGSDPSTPLIATDGSSNGGNYFTGNLNGTNLIAPEAMFLLFMNKEQYYSFALCAGTGTAEPTENDYSLTQMTVANTKLSTNSGAFNSDGNLELSSMITNSSNEPRTYTEVAFSIYVNANSSSNVSQYKRYLLSRSLLSTPITLQPGESATITIMVGR